MKTAPLAIVHSNLSQSRRFLAGWAVAIVAVLSLYLPLFPSMKSAELDALLSSMPRELVDAIGYDEISTGAGYAHATFFGLLGYVLLCIAAISAATARTAKNEESGALEVILAHRVSRASYAWQALLTLLACLALFAAVAFAVLTAYNRPFELDLTLAGIVGEVLAWASLGMLAGCCALAGGLATGRSVYAIGAGAAVAVAGYVFNAVANMSETLSWLAHLSPLHWAYGSTPLGDAPDAAGLASVTALALAVFAMGLARFVRRDLS